MTALEQDAGRTGQYILRGMVDKEPLDLRRQLADTVSFVSFQDRGNSAAEEVPGFLPPSCRGLVDHRTHGTGGGKVEEDPA
ncbi:hypothetical protein [Streptomyces sp. NPDC057257]|uniref:hypothetical protein n=1 Tax=Streptomyces sp. NPDC057257 TaxID=3346071 RepID=UPI00363B2196